MEGDDRVEIELTPNAPRSGRRANPPENAASADGPPPSAGNEVVHWLTAPSHRTAIVAVGVGVGALMLGWTMGRAASDGSDGASAAPATSVSTPHTEPERTNPTVPTVDRPTTVRPPTTTLAPVETSVIEVHPSLAGAPYEFVGLDRAGELVVLDLATGEMTIRRDLGLPRDGGPATLWTGGDWTLLPNWNTGGAVLVADGEDPLDVEDVPGWQLIESDTLGRFWLLDDQVAAGQPGTARLVNRFGEPTRTRVDLTEAPSFADPLGGLVVVSAGGTYRVDTDGASKIADGEVLALDTERAFARLCDDELTCNYVVVDRATGEVTDTPLDPAVRYRSNMWPPSDSTQIAPDGRTVAATWIDPSSFTEMLGLIDLETGAVTVLSSMSQGGIRWSPDGRFAFYLDVGLPLAYDLSTGETVTVAAELPRLDGIDIRAVSP